MEGAFAVMNGGAGAADQYSLLGPLCGIAAVTLVYLLSDVYLSTKTFRGILGCGAFWLL